LISSRSVELRIEAEADTSGETTAVQLRDDTVTEAAVPGSVLRYVLRTHENVILDDASAESPFSADPYIRQQNARSILCLPLINQTKLIGMLYLENNLAPRVFAPSRIAVLKVLASQAAISLENSHLYGDLQEQEAKIPDSAGRTCSCESGHDFGSVHRFDRSRSQSADRGCAQQRPRRP
jgi:GAF domain-containing protein